MSRECRVAGAATEIIQLSVQWLDMIRAVLQSTQEMNDLLQWQRAHPHGIASEGSAMVELTRQVNPMLLPMVHREHSVVLAMHLAP